MHYVFAETNWVVGYAAPGHHGVPAAKRLAERAAAGEVYIKVPALSFSEARATIRRKFKPRHEADAIRQFLVAQRSTGRITEDEAGAVRKVLNLFETCIEQDLRQLDQTLRELRTQPGVEVFALDDEMLAMAADLTEAPLELQPFDHAVLAAVLVEAKRLRARGADAVCFCELDRDLQPWDRQGRAKEPLASLYRTAGVEVYSTFAI